MSKCYCDNCDNYVGYKVKKVAEVVYVKGVVKNVVVYEAYCKKCGQRVYVEKLAKKNDKIVLGRC